MDLLRAAARAARGEAPEGLPEGLLRFHLEYPGAPDLAAERSRLAALLGADGFVLRLLPPGDDPALLLLEFPGIMREQSPALLFAEAEELVDALGLVSCVPETDAGWVNGDELGRDMPESVEGLVARFCDSQAPHPADPHWSVKAVRADRAWARFGTQGEGIVVAQPDTGVASHREIDLGVDLSAGIDIMKGSGPPIDPLTMKGGNPGHGTATSSCVVSSPDGRMVGTAPGARLVPIRCINAVVLTGGAATAAAIDHAVKVGAHVITMSLGGPIPFPALRRAIQRAVDAGVIVLAAAGNCVKIVVYPGWDRNIIGVAGVDEHDRPWKGSCRGPAVDISAPGEHVWVARRSRPDDADQALASPGQGTSFAVATTAGVVALWLAHHGVAQVRAEAARRGITAAALARSALIATARKPSPWPGGMGAGVVDAEALLALPLSAIPAAAAKADHHPVGESTGIDLDRHGAEAGFLMFDAEQRADPARTMALESPVVPTPSPQLRAALKAAGHAELFAAPAIITGPATPEMSPRKALRILAGPHPDGKGGVVESTAGTTEAAARAFLSGDGRDEIVGLAETVLKGLDPARDSSQAVTALRKDVLARTPGVLKAIGEGKAIHRMAPEERFATEALIRMTGRPAMRIRNGALDPQHPEMGDWVTSLVGTAAEKWLKPLLAAVGRIDLQDADGRQLHAGTGTVVADGLVMTNRHVLDAVADPLPGGGFVLRGPVSIIFDDDAKDERQRFALTQVVAAGAERIGRHVDLGRLDMAFFAIAPSNDAGAAPPPPAPVAGPMPSDYSDRVVVVGYPARPGAGAVIDPDTGQPAVSMIDRLAEIYQDEYGVKYLSPGEVEAAVGALAQDPRGWAFSHDATTLGGNSGSPVLELETKHLCGLHFGGGPLRQNLAHGLEAVKALAERERVIDPQVIARLFRRGDG